jgi:hypothetical protein
MSNVRTMTIAPSPAQGLAGPQQTGLAAPNDLRKLSPRLRQMYQQAAGDENLDRPVTVEIVVSDPWKFKQALKDSNLDEGSTFAQVSDSVYRNQTRLKYVPWTSHHEGVQVVRVKGEAARSQQQQSSGSGQQQRQQAGLPDWMPYAIVGGGALLAGGVWLSRRSGE